MQTSVTQHKARLVETQWLLPAFLIFVLGSASGFVVRAVSAPTAASTPAVAVVRVTEPCPSGSHAVVWYSPKAWGCMSDSYGVTHK